jgi:hypothetical protein
MAAAPGIKPYNLATWQVFEFGSATALRKQDLRSLLELGPARISFTLFTVIDPEPTYVGATYFVPWCTSVCIIVIFICITLNWPAACCTFFWV